MIFALISFWHLRNKTFYIISVSAHNCHIVKYLQPWPEGERKGEKRGTLNILMDIINWMPAVDRKCWGTQWLQMESLCKWKAARLQTGHQSRLPAAGIRVLTPPSNSVWRPSVLEETWDIRGSDSATEERWWVCVLTTFFFFFFFNLNQDRSDWSIIDLFASTRKGRF